MKSKLFSVFAALLPFLGNSAQFDSLLHFQVGTQTPETTSYMKLTGNLYDYIPGTHAMWIISPKIYLNPCVPVDFAGSVGFKFPAGPCVFGYHVFGHFHNFGDFPVNQFGHTLECLHNRWETRVNYYHKADGIYPLSYGILSSRRLDLEVAFKMPSAVISGGPIYQFNQYPPQANYSSGQEWGFLGRVAFVSESTDLGVEIQGLPMSEPVTSLFMTFKFPNKNAPKLSPKGNNSCHYTNLSLSGPISYNPLDISNNEKDMVDKVEN